MSAAEIAGERARAADATTAQGKPKDDMKQRALLAGGIVAVAVGLGVAFHLTKPDPRKSDEPKKVIRQTSSFEPAPEPKLQGVAQALAATAAPPPKPLAPPAPAIDPLMESARRAPVVAFKRTVGDTSGSALPSRGAGDLDADDKGLFERRLQPPRTESTCLAARSCRDCR